MYFLSIGSVFSEPVEFADMLPIVSVIAIIEVIVKDFTVTVVHCLYCLQNCWFAFAVLDLREILCGCNRLLLFGCILYN